MQIPFHSVADLGLALRAVRRSSKVRIDDLADTAGVSKQFASDVEHGKPTVQMGRVFALLDELGIQVTASIPQEALEELNSLIAKGGLPPVKPRKPRLTPPAP